MARDARRRRVGTAALLLGLAIGGAGCECGSEREGDARERARAAESASAGGDDAPEDGSRGPAVRLREPGPDVPEPTRFEPIDPALAAGSIRARGWASMEDLRRGAAARMSLGNWLCRLWTHYGEPPQVQRDGFVYAFRDGETGAVITAYSAGSGPAMGALLHEGDGEDAQQRVAESVNAFVLSMDATEPSPCELELEGDLGRIRVGVRAQGAGLEWFEESME